MKQLMSNKIDSNESNCIWCIKGLAVIAIVACHCTQVKDSPSRLNQIVTVFFSYWISLGVPIFYFISGYLFHSETNILLFIKKKIVFIFIPWLITGTVIWLYIVLRKGGLDFSNWFYFVFQKGSYLYFLNDLVAYYLIFYYFNKYGQLKWAAGLLIILITAGLFTGVDFLQIDKVISIRFLVMFFLGMLCKKLNKGLLTFENNKYCLSIMLFLLIKWAQTDQKLGYTVESLLMILSALSLLIFFVSCFSHMSNNRWIVTLKTIGVYSFSIYLTHMPIAGFCAWLLNKSEYFAIFTLFRPLIVIAINLILLKYYEKIFYKYGFMRKIIGIR